MAWFAYLPVVLWCVIVFCAGLAVGSFLNVLIARLPFEKSIIWPSSRCFACYTPIRAFDNVPILGYLRLRGRCRTCGATFSSRYLWVEIGTGLGFLGLFVVEVLLNIYRIPALNNFNILAGNNPLPPWEGLTLFVYHAILLSALIAAAAIDAEHRIIPALIPYSGLAIGIVGGAFMPWPWPNPASAGIINPVGVPPGAPWMLSNFWGKIPLGAQPWPFWGPAFEFARPGSIQLGLLNGVFGALVGSLVVRTIRWLFGAGFGREALGMGDADLLMMAGAFLGWQIAVLSLFVGAVAALIVKVVTVLLVPEPELVAESQIEGQPVADARELPFGPGLAIGVLATWLTWPWIAPQVQFVFFDPITFGLATFIMCVGLVAAGLLLRRPEPSPAEVKA